MRDRAQELLDEEAVAGGDARGHVGRGRRARPAAPLARRSTGCSRTPAQARCRCCRRPTAPTRRASPASAFDPVVGDADALARRLRALARRGLPRRARGGGDRLGAAAARRPRRRGPRRRARAHPRRARCGWWSRRSNAVSSCPARSSRSSPRPTSPAVDACTAGRAARAAAQRLLRRPRARRLRRALPARRRPLPGDEAARRWAASSATTCWLEFKDGKVYVPTDQVGTRPQVHRRRDADAQPHGRRRLREATGAGAQRGARDRRGARGALPPAAGDARAAPSVPTRRGSTRSRRRSRSRRRPTSCRRSTTSRPTWSARSRWTGSSAATSGTARPRSRCAPRSRPCRTARRSSCSCPPRCSPDQHGQTFRERFANYPVRVEVLSRFLSREGAVGGGARLRVGRGRRA